MDTKGRRGLQAGKIVGIWAKDQVDVQGRRVGCMSCLRRVGGWIAAGKNADNCCKNGRHRDTKEVTETIQIGAREKAQKRWS
jgi:hypothetical protein